MKKFISFVNIGLVLCFLTACTPHAKDISNSYPVLPEGLKDCKMYQIFSNDASSVLTVVRCPNSTVTTKSGKVTTTVVEQ